MVADEFMAIMEGVEFDDEPDVIDVSTLSDLELVDAYANTRQSLLQSGQMTADDRTLSNTYSTPEGRDLHSLRVALLVELRKRNLAP